MKKTALFVIVLALSIGLFAQNNENSSKEGKVVYEDVMKLDIKLEGAAAQFADQLPKERRSKKELLFNENSSLYQNIKEDESAEEVAMEQGGMMMKMSMMEPDNKLFYDLNKSETIEQREFMTRMFLIKSKIEQGEWKMTGEQKTILDYPCFQAVKTNEDGEKTKAWFSPAIPVASGPSNYFGLPGMVLQVEMEDGEHTITAISVEFEAIDKKLLVKPRKGKKVNQTEFDKIVEEKMKEMGAEHGEGGSTFMIQIHK
ncbi:MAG: GLPGLI family protein [Bacteroidales bacterium]|nr:GLPGLI family protein [Bacteroidales bacterium]